MIFNIGTGPIRRLPVLDEAYPQDVTANSVGDTVSFQVVIAAPGSPDEYTYQWYYDGAAVSGATGDSYSRSAVLGSHSVHCIVSSKVGTVVSRTATITANKQYLYNNGNEYTAVTGGFGGRRLTKGSNYLLTKGDYWESSGYGLIYTKNKINMTNYKTLKINVTAITTSSNYIYMTIDDSQKPEGSKKAELKITSTGVKSINISSISGSYYPSILIIDSATSAHSEIKINQWWMEA